MDGAGLLRGAPWAVGVGGGVGRVGRRGRGREGVDEQLQAGVCEGGVGDDEVAGKVQDGEEEGLGQRERWREGSRGAEGDGWELGSRRLVRAVAAEVPESVSAVRGNY